MVTSRAFPLWLLALFASCNAILGNEEGKLVPSDGGTSGASGSSSMTGGTHDTIAGRASEAGASIGGVDAGGVGNGDAGDQNLSGGAGGDPGGSTTGGSVSGTGGSPGGAGGNGGSSTGGASGSGGAGATTCDTKVGKAIQFAEKVTDMVAGDLGTDATLGDLPRTLELWAKFIGANSWTPEQVLIEIGKPSNQPNQVFGIDMSGRNGLAGVFGPYTNGASDNNGTDALPQLANTPVDVGWLHLSWAYDPTKNPDSTRLEFTVNGNVLPIAFSQGSYDQTGAKLVGNTGYVLLGASQKFGITGWDGVMDEVRLWNVYRTPDQIKANMRVIVKPTTPGLVAYYQFNEADAANIADSTKKASHKLAACVAAGGACPAANNTPLTFVDSDIPGAFTCAP
jgi:hypothetical protein